MSRSIGAVNFDLFYGDIQTSRLTVDTWVVPGRDSIGAIKNGSRSPESQLMTVLYVDDDPSAVLHGTACIAMQGTVQTISDAFGDNFDNCLILDVDCRDFKHACIKDDVPKVRCQIYWRVISL